MNYQPSSAVGSRFLLWTLKWDGHYHRSFNPWELSNFSFWVSLLLSLDYEKHRNTGHRCRKKRGFGKRLSLHLWNMHIEKLNYSTYCMIPKTCKGLNYMACFIFIFIFIFVCPVFGRVIAMTTLIEWWVKIFFPYYKESRYTSHSF